MFTHHTHSRIVIGVGVEEEDRLDQWITDAESVSITHSHCTCVYIHTVFSTIVSSHVLYPYSALLTKRTNVPVPYTPTHSLSSPTRRASG